MPIKEATIKRLFAKSHGVCAMPRCTSELVIGEHVIAEICHIRARQRRGPRFDPNLTAEQKDAFANLVLLCPTCHTLVDKNPHTYSVELLTDIKEMHERGASLEITPDIARHAMLVLEKYRGLSSVKVRETNTTSAVALKGGIAIAVARDNVGSIHVHAASRSKETGTRYPINSIGADANMTNYIDYLCDLYVKYMSPIDCDESRLRAKLGQHIENKFRLRKRTRNQLSADRFFALVRYLIDEKLAKTPVGSRHLREGKKLCRTFDEFRYDPM